ncbi:DUF805 domain-containing protein [Nocardioides sp. S-58]|uniref:DUF805 domain-containing protein n=1 Tax=Nocardioides renjunii TaxID=3095075 RepID=A0ABU5KEX2_9ACTN|nr:MULTISPECIES: DUF805 domain-containing protein [unclassified Nocardioides]MDZ5663501.1 DUF805 domain-containing protein [Nocardioides sp. S-58]WQQ20588.1 DUF805 domain-containing protein [Nocardioides sp. S-34]
MDFMTAVRTCLSKYVDFSGRARRSEYWYFALFNFLVGIVTSILDAILGTGYDDSTGGLFNTLGALALLLPSLAVGVRRLHDTGRSGWWILLGLIPLIGWIILIVWFCTDSKPDNQWGPNPKHAGAAGGYPPPPPAAPYGSGQYGG